MKKIFCARYLQHLPTGNNVSFATPFHIWTRARLISSFSKNEFQKYSTPASNNFKLVNNLNHVRNNSVISNPITDQPSLALKRKIKKKKKQMDVEKVGFNQVLAYSTAEEYDLEGTFTYFQKYNCYSVEDLSLELGGNVDAIYVLSNKGWEVFFFREGSIVFWNAPQQEATDMLHLIKQFEIKSFNEEIVKCEKEVMNYRVSNQKPNTMLRNEDIIFGVNCDLKLEKYAISNAIAASTTLGIWESYLEKYASGMEDVIEDLKRGEKVRISREEVLKKTGELFSFRHDINLSNDLLDTPDFYWDREKLEDLYLSTVKYLCVAKRTTVMNEKISHCLEVVELLSSHLSDNHHVRLEWMIIILICIEVLFEFLHIAGI